jgi:APA family basic amino acid/polyamine antiporter
LKNSLKKDPSLKREIGFVSATALVIANMVGTGIFMTSGFIIHEVKEPLGLLFCWLMGGAFSFCGALCYAELGAAFPRAGGEYVFLKESFGPWAGFLSGWISLVVGFSAPIAAAAVAFSTYLLRCLQIRPEDLEVDVSIMGFKFLTLSSVSIIALAVILLFSLVHYRSLTFGSRIQNVLTAFKIGLILVFITAGFFFGDGSWSHFAMNFDGGLSFNQNFAVSLIFVSFAYSGWNAAAYIGSEIENPQRNLPLSLLTGTGIVAVLYLFLNVLYVYALPPEKMAGVMEVGVQSAVALFGKDIGCIFSGAIALGILSVISAMIMTGPRIYYAMGRDKVFFNLFGQIKPGHHTPGKAIFFQAFVASTLVLTAAFDQLLIYIGFTLSLCTLFTVAGLMVLRHRQPDRLLAYRIPFYPLPALFFIAGNLWIVCFSVTSRPLASLCGLATIGFGIGLYQLFFNTDHHRCVISSKDDTERLI